MSKFLSFSYGLDERSLEIHTVKKGCKKLLICFVKSIDSSCTGEYKTFPFIGKSNLAKFAENITLHHKYMFNCSFILLLAYFDKVY